MEWLKHSLAARIVLFLLVCAVATVVLMVFFWHPQGCGVGPWLCP